MTFDLAAFETPAHFRPSTNHLSCKRRLLTRVGDANIHAPVFADLGVAKRIPPNQYGTGSRTKDGQNGTHRTRATAFRARRRYRRGSRRSHCWTFFATGGKAQRRLRTTGA
jgi:hypothetical protein